ncbi:glutaredoxin-1 [Callorhinchus milii]|uniref:Glutaredoxin-1 n=1 Tax=Callorhinchus milii TaxID=7868 RepID=K4FTE3_CALMI|nr:glutaredoxin-1 [Callorhinchus milii]AFK11413.1 glutaredoxin-1 [Callorhinchus milii]|eukprot:gi/632951403/ref/XP_007891276.1/ PREDICTED: glutaredoxin-1 [Callorhinchus milii]
MAQQFVESRISFDKVVLFIKPTCPFCISAQKVLNKYQFKAGRLQIHDITSHPEASSVQDYLQQKTGARTVPRVFIGEKCIGGGSDVEQLERSGKLKDMLHNIAAI